MAAALHAHVTFEPVVCTLGVIIIVLVVDGKVFGLKATVITPLVPIAIDFTLFVPVVVGAV